MTMQLTTDGFQKDRFYNIQEDINTQIQLDISEDIDLTANSLVNDLVSCYAVAENSAQSAALGVWDSIDVLTAEDIILDNLAIMVGYVRLNPTATTGTVNFTTKSGFVLDEDFIVTTKTGNPFTPVRSSAILTESCLDCRITVGSIFNNTEYLIVVQDQAYTYRTPASATALDILTQLSSLINSHGVLDSVVVDGDVPYMQVDKKDKGSTMNIFGISYLNFDYVTAPVTVISSVLGVIPAAVGVITEIPDRAVQGVYSVYNPQALTTGSQQETDQAFRQRIMEGFSSVSGGTPDSLYDTLITLNGVNSVKIKENTTRVTDSDFLPPNSFQAVIDGGNTDVIAKAIWENKPSGIQAWALADAPESVQVDILDYNSQKHFVQFRRPSTLYTYVVINYTLYDEELFTENGEAVMAESVALDVNALQIGQDIIPKRYYSGLYNTVSGLENIEIFVATTLDLLVPPVYPTDYVNVTVPVTDEQIPNLTAERVQFNL